MFQQKKRVGPRFMQTIADKITKTVPVLDRLPDKVLQAVTVGGITAGASLLASYFQGEFRPQEEGESIEDYLAARKKAVGTQMRNYMDNYFKFDKEYSTMTDAQRDAFVARYNVRDGGRIGYALGGNELPPDPTAPVNPFKPKPIGPVLPNKMMADLDAIKEGYSELMFGKPVKELTPDELIELEIMLKDKLGGPFSKKRNAPKGIMMDRTMADKGGVMGIPVRMNSEGVKELDYRKTGGFVPIGVKEKADDVPAMLSKNEFVMTADAVRGAGDGSINKGAQRMYDTMKKLESRVA